MATRRGTRGSLGWSYPPQYPYPQYGYGYPPYGYPPMYPLAPQMSPEDELAYLEGYKRQLEAEKAGIERKINEIEQRIKELREMLERGGQRQPPPQGP